MASFTTSNVSTNLVGRELSIASSFVKQYYTLLNKAPCYIHNFYSQDSTFIHGTIEMANEHYTEPIVGREKIKRKMEDLKLNDCRAKIKQIDCLETLAGGLVIQVIGELSNNGRPMRRFLQTFVLAPSSDETRSDNDIKNAKSSNMDRRPANLNSEPSNNQKFFVLNSIFRYQDDGTENEFDEDSVSSAAMNSAEVFNERNETETAQKQNLGASQDTIANGASKDTLHSRKKHSEIIIRTSDEVERLSNDLEMGTKLSGKAIIENETKKEASNVKVVSNGNSGPPERRHETVEKIKENVKSNPDQAQSSSSTPKQIIINQAPSVTAPRPVPTNEPRTWATMLRNANPTSSTPAQPVVGKSMPTDQVQPNQPQSQPQPQLQSQPQQPPQPPQQPQQSQPQQTQIQSQTQIPLPQPQQQQLQQQQPPQQQNINSTLPPNTNQSSPLSQSQQLNPQLVSGNGGNNIGININNNTNIRRRHMTRKPSNKTNSGGRPLKNRPPRPPTMGRPLA